MNNPFKTIIRKQPSGWVVAIYIPPLPPEEWIKLYYGRFEDAWEAAVSEYRGSPAEYRGARSWEVFTMPTSYLAAIVEEIGSCV